MVCIPYVSVPMKDGVFADDGEVNGFAFDFEAILWATKLGMKIKEIPVKIINHRESKVHVFSDTFKMLRDLRRMKRRIGSIRVELN